MKHDYNDENHCELLGNLYAFLIQENFEVMFYSVHVDCFMPNQLFLITTYRQMQYSHIIAATTLNNLIDSIIKLIDSWPWFRIGSKKIIDRVRNYQ